ncbi:LPXTG cell wall anchor domain-containing protein [Breznakia pachnodae]|uniref:LPXTG-motif cell wall-anchored protein n=1 Tax=Breznakia pachnodae TaxID=265178 RepID=A0ABU0E0P0_9FIRM|nr:LPXTG cell wall anchor domain-containing protein [Breznakia pachnodae]MDQ0360447.1 LPXTG-motif cell wall-anchored protein [Breznakia pachnodae]
MQQPNGSYTLKDTDNFSGTIGSVVNANIKTYNGYVYTNSVNGTKISGVIVEDGSLVLKVYYRKSPLSFIVNPSTATKDGISISQSVQTGDDTNNAWYIGMAGISLLIVLYGVRRKKSKI